MMSEVLLVERPIGIVKKKIHPETDHMIYYDNNSSFSVSACMYGTRRLRDNYKREFPA